MDAPTKEQPRLSHRGTPITMTRGYEVVVPGQDKLDFIGCFDGPTLRLEAPGHVPWLIPVEMLPVVQEMLAAVVLQPVCPADAHDVELAQMGYTRVPR